MSDVNNNKEYKSYKIPDRKQDQANRIVQQSPDKKSMMMSSLADGMFYEIEYDSDPVPGCGKYVLRPQLQKIEEPERDEIRELFSQMRDIARKHRSIHDFSRFFDRRVQNDNAKIFHQQGSFMKDFTDDYAENMQFSQYFPNYQMMGYKQLRTYFTWRTRVREGDIADTSLSYAFLYIYELLGNIGVTDPLDGLDKLMSFWKAFSKHNKSIDKYIIRWLKDYHIYYTLPHSFKEFVDMNGLAAHYPKIAGTDDSFDLFCAISKYNIKKSVFFTDETSKMISDCFSFVINKIRRDFKASGMDFDNVLFRTARKVVLWKPFKDALFYHWLKQPDKQIVLSENEIYMCKKNEWTFSTVIITEKGRQFVGYVMKRMESVLRKITKYRYRITANINMVNGDTIRKLSKAGLFIEDIVPAAVAGYHRETAKTVVTVDQASLARIRQEALATQESLTVEDHILKKETVPTPILFADQDQNIFADTSEEGPSPVSDVWENLRDILNESELSALAAVLQGNDIKSFADDCGVMKEVLADGINEKAMDYIGDNLMDDDFNLYEDYRDQVSRLLALERNR